MLQIQRFVFNLFHENTYLIWDDQTKEAAVIDPGMYDDDEKKVFEKFVTEKNLKLLYCINTHCHIDHVLGNSYIKNKYKCELIIPEKDEPLLENMNQQAKLFGLTVDEMILPDKFISEEISLNLGTISGKYLFTPGHTPGEYCIYFPTEKILFSGDVLFKLSIGRTDLWGGDQATLFNSIGTKLFTLPEDVVVYPGHESSTSIGFEKMNNPYVAV